MSGSRVSAGGGLRARGQHKPRRTAQTRQHRLYKADLVAYNTDTVRSVEECDGARNCTARLHAHGCLADVSGSRCDDPEAHR